MVLRDRWCRLESKQCQNVVDCVPRPSKTPSTGKTACFYASDRECTVCRGISVPEKQCTCTLLYVYAIILHIMIYPVKIRKVLYERMRLSSLHW